MYTGSERDELIEEDRIVISGRWEGGLEKKELMLVNKYKFIKGEVLVLGHIASQLQLIADVLYISKQLDNFHNLFTKKLIKK